MSPLTRDDPRYWQTKPTDHNAVGFFIDGPQPAEPITNRLARLTRSRCDVPAEGPRGAHQRMAREREHRRRVIERHLSFVKAVFEAQPKGRRFVRPRSA
jgi:hypothetical protein